MRVALVADTFSVAEGTGIARYALQLLSGLTHEGLSVEPITHQPPQIPFGLAVNHALCLPYLVARRAERFDVLHAASPITALAFPLIHKPKVVTYHDLASLGRRGRAGTGLHARLFAPLFLRIGHLADRVIANSAQTKRDIVSHLGIPSEKIITVQWGIDDRFRPQLGHNSPKRVVGYVGAMNPRKGLPYLIRAFHALRCQCPDLAVKLVICGRRNDQYPGLARLVQELGLSDSVEFRGSVSDDQLVEVYNSFDVFVLPSEWEGFGFPILEAQRCEVPVIIREDAHIPEEVAACCLKATSEKDMADRIYALLTEEDLRQAVVEQGLEYSQQFTWARAVEQTIAVYEDVLSER